MDASPPERCRQAAATRRVTGYPKLVESEAAKNQPHSGWYVPSQIPFPVCQPVRFSPEPPAVVVPAARIFVQHPGNLSPGRNSSERLPPAWRRSGMILRVPYRRIEPDDSPPPVFHHERSPRGLRRPCSPRLLTIPLTSDFSNRPPRQTGTRPFHQLRSPTASSYQS